MKSKISILSRGILFMLLWTFSLCIFSQNVSVTGVVHDINGDPLIGVTIQVKGILTEIH